MSSSGNMIIEKLTEIIDLCNVWIIDEDGRNFSLRQPSEKECSEIEKRSYRRCGNCIIQE